MADFEIGGFSFITLDRPPNRPRQQIHLVARAGVANVAAYETAKRTEPFRLNSSADIASTVADAEDEFRDYEDAVGTVVSIKWNGVTADGTFLILGVDLIAITRAMSPVGGLVGGGAVLRAAWTLVAVT